jgi:hypothetical protein
MNMDRNMRDEIARVAYGLFEKRGYTPGNDFLDWIEAEKIVIKKYSKEMTGTVKPVKPIQPASAKAPAKSKSRGQFPRPTAR